jgi:hypothetical protein
MSDPQHGKQAKQDQANDVVFVETSHVSLLHSQRRLKTTRSHRDDNAGRRYRRAARKCSGRGVSATSAARRAISFAWL